MRRRGQTAQNLHDRCERQTPGIGSKHDTQQVRDTIGALYSELHETRGAVKEIHRRLHAGEAGLDFKVPISERQIYNYLSDYHAEHGHPSTQDDGQEEAQADSIAAIKRRAVALIKREVGALENVRPGKMTADQSTALRRLYSTLDDMERREEAAAKRKGKGKVAKAPEPEKQESTIDRIAREERERQAKGTPSKPAQPGPQSSEAHRETGGAASSEEDAGDGRESHGEGKDAGQESGHQEGQEQQAAGEEVQPSLPRASNQGDVPSLSQAGDRAREAA